MRAAEKAEHDDWIRTVGAEIQIPRVIRLHTYDQVPRHAVRFNRRNLFARDGNRCQYCGDSYPSTQLSFDHVVPRSRGGETNWENVVCACLKCNVKKGGRTPSQAQMKLVRKPLKPKNNPVIHIHLNHERYRSWKQFLDHAYWSVELT